MTDSTHYNNMAKAAINIETLRRETFNRGGNYGEWIQAIADALADSCSIEHLRLEFASSLILKQYGATFPRFYDDGPHPTEPGAGCYKHMLYLFHDDWAKMKMQGIDIKNNGEVIAPA